MRVVVTRPQDRAEATAASLRGMGHEPQPLPLSRARHLPDQARELLAEKHAAIAVTSAEALRAVAGFDLSAHLTRPLFAVGRKTAAAAQEAGFKTIEIADGDGASLAALIARNAPAGVVYLTGKPRSPTFEMALQAANIPHTVIECYEMIPLAPSNEDVLAMFDPPPAAILFHSRETARLFFALPAIAKNLAVLSPGLIACLSARVAEEVPPALRDRVKIAERPDESALLALL